MSTDRRIDKHDVVYTHTHTHTRTRQYFLAMKKNEIFAATWMDLEITLSEIRQMYHLHVESKV